MMICIGDIADLQYSIFVHIIRCNLVIAVKAHNARHLSVTSTQGIYHIRS